MALRRRNKFDYVLYQDGQVDTEQPNKTSVYGFLKPDEYKDKPNNSLTWRAIWRGFNSNTTAHGIQHVHHAQGLVKKIFWSILSLIAFVCFVINAHSLTVRFLAHEVITTVNVQHERQLTFPAVTVCNSNPILASEILKYDELSDILNVHAPHRRNKRSIADIENEINKRVKRNLEIPPLPREEDYEDIAPFVPSTTAPEGIHTNSTTTSTTTQPSVQRKQKQEQYQNGTQPVQNTTKTANTDQVNSTSPSVPTQTPKPKDTDLVQPKKQEIGDELRQQQQNEQQHSAMSSDQQQQQQQPTTLPGNLAKESTSQPQPLRPTQSPTPPPSPQHLPKTTTMNEMQNNPSTKSPGLHLKSSVKPEQLQEAVSTAVPTLQPIQQQHNKQTTTLSPLQQEQEEELSGDDSILNQQKQDNNIPNESRPQSSKSVKDAVTNQLNKMTLAQKTQLGTKVNKFILQCEYGGQPCNISSDFDLFYDTEYGNCFTFNWGVNKSRIVNTATRTGKQNGLHLTFDVDQDEYVGHFAPSAGVRVVVHPRGTVPYPQEEGVSVPPGYLTDLSLTQRSFHRKSPNCHQDEINVVKPSRDMFKEHYSSNYSVKTCLRTCYQRFVVERCGCFDSKYSSYDEANRVHMCKSTNTTQANCLRNTQRLHTTGDLKCHCKESCNEKTFVPSVSSSVWPSDKYLDILRSELETPDLSRKEYFENSKGEVSNKYQRNLGKLVVYFQDFRHELIEEKVAYSIDRFLSDLGGILGLYIGFSVLTILEFWELLLDFMVLGLIKLSTKANCKSDTMRSNSRVKIEPFVTRESSGEAAEAACNDNENPAYPCQMQTLAY